MSSRCRRIEHGFAFTVAVIVMIAGICLSGVTTFFAFKATTTSKAMFFSLHTVNFTINGFIGGLFLAKIIGTPNQNIQYLKKQLNDYQKQFKAIALPTTSLSKLNLSVEAFEGPANSPQRIALAHNTRLTELLMSKDRVFRDTQ